MCTRVSRLDYYFVMHFAISAHLPGHLCTRPTPSSGDDVMEAIGKFCIPCNFTGNMASDESMRPIFKQVCCCGYLHFN